MDKLKLLVSAIDNDYVQRSEVLDNTDNKFKYTKNLFNQTTKDTFRYNPSTLDDDTPRYGTSSQRLNPNEIGFRDPQNEVLDYDTFTISDCQQEIKSSYRFIEQEDEELIKKLTRKNLYDKAPKEDNFEIIKKELELNLSLLNKDKEKKFKVLDKIQEESKKLIDEERKSIIINILTPYIDKEVPSELNPQALDSFLSAKELLKQARCLAEEMDFCACKDKILDATIVYPEMRDSRLTNLILSI